MQIKDAAAWGEYVAANTDPYGLACVEFASRWAEAMERRMVGGASLAEVAKVAAHEADTDGITGSMYGAAVVILVRCWEHGEALRRWHNLDTQIGTEGEAANESGGVLNPVLLRVRRK